MSFTARLSSDLVSVEAGATVPLSVEIANKGDRQERFEITIEGCDPEWTAIPVPEFTVDAGETQSEKLFFKPARVSESLAGNYPFVVRVRSLVSGEHKAVQGVLQIKPFHHLSMEISPKKGYVTPMNPRDTFGATIMNLGNTEHALQLFGGDPEDECAFDFEHDQITISPGQQKTIEVGLTTNSKRWFSGTRLHGFSISARSIETPSVVASAQAQLEQRPLLSPSAIFALLIFAIIAGFWIYLIPKPPSIRLQIDRRDVVLGDPVQITWQANNAQTVTVTIDGEVLFDGAETSGAKTWTPRSTGTLVIQAMSKRDEKTSLPAIQPIQVRAPAPIPDAKIIEFKPATPAITLGQSVIISYKFENVTKATLAPTGQDLNLSLDQIEVTPTTVGEVTYTVAAQNSAGRVVRESFKVSVNEPNTAFIVAFTASQNPVPLEVGKVTLDWQITGAVRAEVSDGRTTIRLDQMMGTKKIDIRATTTYTLTAYDEKGRTVKRTLKVRVEAPKPPPMGPVDEGGSGTTTGSATTAGGR